MTITLQQLDQIYDEFITPVMRDRCYPFEIPHALIESTREKLRAGIDSLPQTIIGAIAKLSDIAVDDAVQFRETIIKLSGLDPDVFNECKVIESSRGAKMIVRYVKSRPTSKTIVYCNIKLPI